MSIYVRRALVLAAVWLGMIGVFLVFVRPWHRGWGATAEERRLALPSDSIVLGEKEPSETRAITIHAPPSAVWPWLAQLGQDRGGFYSYRVLENLVGCNMPDATSVHREWQAWKLGDNLWMYPPDKANGAAHARLTVYEEGKVLGFATRQFGTPVDRPYDGSWSFVIVPAGPSQTRLITRGEAPVRQNILWEAFDRLVFEPAHFVMERRMLTNIQALAEGRHPSAMAQTVEVTLWTLLWLFSAVCAVLFVTGIGNGAALGAFVASAVSFQVLTLAQPPLPGAVALTALVVGIGALGMAMRAGHARFQRRAAGSVNALLRPRPAPVPVLDAFVHLPPVVRRYAEKVVMTGVVPQTVYARQGGSFRTKLDGPWLPLQAQEYFASDPPGFVWWGRVRLFPGLWFEALDQSIAGEGRMHVEVAALLPVADSAGHGIDAGSLVRLLGEMVWFPTALFDRRYVTWASVDDASARATLRVGALSVSATFHFGSDGLVSRMSTVRAFDLGNGATEDRPWSVAISDYQNAGGFLVPHTAAVYWEVEGVQTPTIRMTIENIEYDPPSSPTAAFGR